MLELNKIYCMDNVDGMKLLDDDCIDLTITSPPYDDIRSYNGFSWHPENLIKELYRITKSGGGVVWVVGVSTKNFSESLSSFTQAFLFVKNGFSLLDTMIYYKKNYAPAYPTLRRYANQFEYMFVFCKGKPKTFNPVQREKIIKNYKQKRSYFRQKDGSQILKLIDNNRETKDASNVWEFATTVTDKNSKGHPAIFPEPLVNDHILSWSNENDTVLDPFMGSGTTAKMSKLLNRKYIGFEISQEYCDIANNRLDK